MHANEGKIRTELPDVQPSLRFLLDEGLPSFFNTICGSDKHHQRNQRSHKSTVHKCVYLYFLISITRSTFVPENKPWLTCTQHQFRNNNQLDGDLLTIYAFNLYTLLYPPLYPVKRKLYPELYLFIPFYTLLYPNLNII
jgi:hypothetical protein